MPHWSKVSWNLVPKALSSTDPLCEPWFPHSVSGQGKEYHTEQKPRHRWSPLWVQIMARLSWPLQELLQMSRPSTQTSASISPDGSSSKLDTEPQPATWHCVPALSGLELLYGSPSNPTAGPRMAELFSCRERPPPNVTSAPASVYPYVTPRLFPYGEKPTAASFCCQKACCFCQHVAPAHQASPPHTRTVAFFHSPSCPNSLSNQHLLPCFRPSYGSPLPSG